MIALRLLIPRMDRRERLDEALSADPDLTVVCTGADFDDITGRPNLGADVIVVDLDHPCAGQSRFWSALHVYFPGARLMVLAEAPIEPLRLEAALHAGAYYMVEWCEPLERIWRAAHAAGECDGFIPLGNVINAICAYFANRGLGWGKIRIGNCLFDPQRGVIERGTKQIALTKLERALLLYLVANPERPVPKDELLSEVWRQSSQSSQLGGQIKATVKRLRQKIEPVPERPRYLLNWRGRGYFVPKSVMD